METPNAFQQIFLLMGPWMWPLILLSLIVLFMILKRVYNLFILKQAKKDGVNSILFWGSVTFAAGLLAQISGIWMAFDEIMKAADISPMFVLIGFLSSFATTLFGLTIMIIAAFSWWGLRYIENRRLPS
ncbi:MAG: hypothetical protein R2764_13985 [Bacteroidales bacterium]